MKASPRFREATAYIKLRHQPAQIKHPLLALHIAANPQAYDAAPLNVRPEVSQLRCTVLVLLSGTLKSHSVDALTLLARRQEGQPASKNLDHAAIP